MDDGRAGSAMQGPQPPINVPSNSFAGLTPARCSKLHSPTDHCPCLSVVCSVNCGIPLTLAHWCTLLSFVMQLQLIGLLMLAGTVHRHLHRAGWPRRNQGHAAAQRIGPGGNRTRYLPVLGYPQSRAMMVVAAGTLPVSYMGRGPDSPGCHATLDFSRQVSPAVTHE